MELYPWLNLNDAHRKARLRHLISTDYDSQVAFAVANGLSKSRVSQLTGDEEPFGERAAERLEQAANLPAGWFNSTWPTPKEAAKLGRNIESFGQELNTLPDLGYRGSVPLLSNVQAGAFKEALEHRDGEEMEMVQTTVKVGRQTFALRVQGDSMEPVFVEGMRVVVEPDMEAMPGDYVVARNGDGEATLKQLIKDGADLYLKPSNSRYPIKPLGDAIIIGVVREVIRTFR